MKEIEKTKYIEEECERQWNDCQAEEYGTWENQSAETQNEYRKDMEKYLSETGQLEDDD